MTKVGNATEVAVTHVATNLPLQLIPRSDAVCWQAGSYQIFCVQYLLMGVSVLDIVHVRLLYMTSPTWHMCTSHGW